MGLLERPIHVYVARACETLGVHRDTACMTKGIATETNRHCDGFLNRHAMQQNQPQSNFNPIKIIRNKCYLLMHK